MKSVKASDQVDHRAARLGGLGAAVGLPLLLLWTKFSFAADQIAANSSGAGSPITNYTAGVIAYLLLIGFLISALFVGAFLVLNLGLLSKRNEDRVGGRTPSDVALLKETNWPQESSHRPVLPAEENDYVEEEPGKVA